MIDKVEVNQALDCNDLVIRQVTKNDLAALEWNGEYKKYRRMFANLYRDSVSGRVLLWVVELARGEIIGQAFVLLQCGDHKTANGRDRAYIFAFRVKADWRNQGIGSHLMRFVQNDLQQRGFRYITLNVAKHNPDALRMYKRLGYRVTGTHPGIWSYKDHEGRVHHVNEPAWRMIKALTTN